MIIILTTILSGVVIYFLLEGAFAVVQQKAIDKRLKSALGILVINKEKDIKSVVKNWAFEVGNVIFKIKTPYIKSQFEKLEEMLVKAGKKDVAVNSFLGMQFLSGLGFVFVSIIVLSIYNLFVLFLIFIVGAGVPIAVLAEKIKKRQQDILKGLPDILDILSLLSQAGIDFAASLKITLKNEKGILIDEFKAAEQEINLGKNRVTALQDMASRNDNKYLSNVINTISRSMQSGTPLSQALKTLAENFRQERFTMAEKMGAQAPVKMMIPLILLIFPTIFIIIFGPIVLSFMNGGFW